MTQTLDALQEESTGLYIVFEGIDGCGKTTQIQYLSSYLREFYDYNVVTVQEPGGTPEGDEIRSFLLHSDTDISPFSQYLLLSTARHELMRQVVSPALAQNAVVLGDRSYISSLSYQGYAQGCDIEFMHTANTFVMDGIIPDAVLFLDIPVEEATQHYSTSHRFEAEGRAFMHTVREGYEHILADMDAVHYIPYDRPEAMFAEICAALDPFFTESLTKA